MGQLNRRVYNTHRSGAVQSTVVMIDQFIMICYWLVIYVQYIDTTQIVLIHQLLVTCTYIFQLYCRMSKNMP